MKTQTFQQMFMRSRLWGFVFVLFVARLQADDWDPPAVMTVESANRNYVFRVIPNFGKIPPQLGTCRGQLYLRSNGQLKLQWERPLINNVAPVQAFVANSGQCVVTICEWGGSFEELPVVFYGHHGFLLNVYGRLGQIADRPALNIRELSRGTPWLTNSLFLFGPADATFIIRLSSGNLVSFETTMGELIDESWKKKWGSDPGYMKLYDELQAKVKTLILHDALRLKNSDNPTDRKTGEFVLNQYTDAESAAILRQIVHHEEGRSPQAEQPSQRQDEP